MLANSRKTTRPGSVLPLICVLTVFLIGMVALVIDLGYIAVTRSELQNAADAAALAGAEEMRGTESQRRWYQNRNFERALIRFHERDNAVRQEAQRFGQAHQAGGVRVVIERNVGNDPAGDIVLGYTPKSNPASDLRFDVAPYNTVKVTVYRNDSHGGSLKLFFAPVIGINQADVSATASARYTDSPWSVLPIAMKLTDYLNLLNNTPDPGETDDYAFDPDLAPNSPTDYTNRVLGSPIAPDRDSIPEIRLFPQDLVPGNYATVDLGAPNGSASDMERQIYQGLSAADRALMEQQGLLTNGNLTATYQAPIKVSGDPGVNWGIKNALTNIRGQMRTIPLFTIVEPSGTTALFTIVGFANVTIVEVSNSAGVKDVRVQPIAPFEVFHTTGSNMLGSVTLVR